MHDVEDGCQDALASLPLESTTFSCDAAATVSTL